MRKLAFIPTREEKERPIKVFLEKCGWEVHYLIGKKSIFDAYSNAVKEFKVMAKDKVIFCHDDIEILTSPEIFNHVVEKNLDERTGFLGVAGAKRMNATGCWWHGLGSKFPAPDNFLQGCIWHGKDIVDAIPTYYGGYGKVEVVDGLFMLTTGATLNNIHLKKHPEFKSEWDYYDMYYSIQADRKGRTNKVIPIMILHHSIGEGSMSDEWDASRQTLIKLYGKRFVPIEAPHQSQLPAPA
jgi:hypothetical protein